MKNKKYTIFEQDLPAITIDMRKDILTMCHNCGKQNGHLGGCLSAVEILAVLYTQIMNINEVAHSGIGWENRDRFILSKGHAGFVLYAALKQIGLVSQEMIQGSIRGEQSVLFRHPKKNEQFGIECSVGSLGMGLGYGIGLAEAFRRKNTMQKVFVMLGDGECNEGSVWESAAYAGHRKLENLIVIIDKNKLQLDGYTSDVLNMDNMKERWETFGFQSLEVDGHNWEELMCAFRTEHKGKPLAIIADTIKGKGVSFAENQVQWHDNYLSDELFEKAWEEVGSDDKVKPIREMAKFRFQNKNIILEEQRQFNKICIDYNEENIKKWAKLGSKNVIGNIALEFAKQDKDFTLIYADCANRIDVSELRKQYPNQCYETGIAEQNMITMAAAMANEGLHVFAIAYAPFITARVLDQIRANLGYMKAPVCLIGLSAGMAGGDLGATHTAFEDIANLKCIPNVNVMAPVDMIEIVKCMEGAINDRNPAYIRVTINDKDTLIHLKDYDFKIGKAITMKEGNDIAILFSGSLMEEGFEVCAVLEKRKIRAELINMHTIKPLDTDTIRRILNKKMIVTVEEHNVIGGLGESIASFLAGYSYHAPLLMIGVQDEYFTADVPFNLRKRAGLFADKIVHDIVTAFDANVDDARSLDNESRKLD